MIKSEAWWKHDISAFSAKKITILDIAVVLELKWGVLELLASQRFPVD